MVAAALCLASLLAPASGCGGVDHVDFPDDSDGGLVDGSASGDGALPTDGAACVPNNAADCAGYCGKLRGRCGGTIDCGACPAGLTCGGGGPNLCGTGSCVPKCTSAACGASDGCGGVCATGTCPTGTHCDGGTCACDATSCAGCCSGAACLNGTSTSACGSVGSVCVTCSGGGFCSGGACSGCTPSCNGKACGASDGCGGTCTTGACSTGQRCSSGTCVCDSTSCSGCCSGATCNAGTSASACGTGGQTCTTCSGTQTCSSGSCRGGGAPFLSPCTILFLQGCAATCTSAGGTCVAKCGPSGNAGAEGFDDSACTTNGQWLAGDQCAAGSAATYGACCCQ